MANHHISNLTNTSLNPISNPNTQPSNLPFDPSSLRYGFCKEVVECPAGYEPLESIVRSISTTEALFELKNCSDDCVPLVMDDSCVFFALDLYQVVKAKSRSICPHLKKKMV